MPIQNRGIRINSDGRASWRLVLSVVGLLGFLSLAAFGGIFISGARTTTAVQNPSMALDWTTSDNTYADATNTMNVGTIDNCLSSPAPGDNNVHVHPAHLIIQNVEDLIGWQARFNYLGDQMRPTSVNFTPFTDTTTAQNISFLNLPIDSSTSVHRDVFSPTNIPPAAPGPQTALIGSTYLGAQTFPISPDTPAKSTPDDTSYRAPTGGVLATVNLQVMAGNAGNPSLFTNLDDGSPNFPDTRVVVFNGAGTTDINIPSSQLGDAYHGEGTACVALDCVTQECPTTSTPTPSATPTETPTRRTPPVQTPPHPTPPQHPTPRPHP
jgi:hypothetical protein